MTLTPGISVRAASSKDLGQIVPVHLESFPGFFLSTLGPLFLRQFYAGLVDLDSGILLVAIHNDRVIGFVGGSTHQVGFYSCLLREQRGRFVLAAATAAVRHPSAIPRLIRARDRATGSDESTYDACLMTLGVKPDAEGLGIGRQLVHGFEREAAQSGAIGYCLTTDTDANERANRFYRSIGHHLVQVKVTPEGRRLNEYAKSLGGES